MKVRDLRLAEDETAKAEDGRPTLARDTRGLAAYVAVAVLIAMALLVYGGAKTFGDAANEKFSGQAGAVQSIPSSLGGGAGGGGDGGGGGGGGISSWWPF